MKLDRNTNAAGQGKYAVVKLRAIDEIADEGDRGNVEQCLATLLAAGVLTYGHPGAADEFFVIMLKDQFAPPALVGYAERANCHGEKEYAQEIMQLAKRSGSASPFCKKPD